MQFHHLGHLPTKLMQHNHIQYIAGDIQFIHCHSESFHSTPGMDGCCMRMFGGCGNQCTRLHSFVSFTGTIVPGKGFCRFAHFDAVEPGDAGICF